MPKSPSRPVLRYYGGKWLLAPWVIEHLPPHRLYAEPFCGAASVLLRKPRSFAEVINDRDAEVVNLFEVLRDPAQAKDLANLLRLTPFARDEFARAYLPGQDAIERARRLVVKSFMGHGSIAATRENRTGFRHDAITRGGNSYPVDDWLNYPDKLGMFTERLRGVIVENKPATEIVSIYDHEEALFYCDPPYPASTRSSRTRDAGYRHEMSDDDHRDLAGVLHSVRGMVVISGYPCDLYDQELYPLWTRRERTSRIDGGGRRVEVLWFNAAAASRLNGRLDI